MIETRVHLFGNSFRAHLRPFATDACNMDDDSFLFNDDDPAMDDLFLQALEAVDNAQQQAILITEPQVSHTKPRPPTTTSTKTTVKATAGQQTKQKQKNLFEAFGISQPATVTAPVPARTARLEKNDTKTASPLALKKFDPKNNVDDDDEFVIFDGEPSITHSTDLEAYKTWIYPINYGFRDYQFNIVRRALFSNTLVALPTGLGKTFIASVVMFNFYRWFPKGKVIFMAPTKPLVNQQVEACFGVTGLPPSETAELTGTTASHNRREIWDSKRVSLSMLIVYMNGLSYKNSQVFFITPHVLQNDLESGCCSVDDIVLIVVDEVSVCRCS